MGLGWKHTVPGPLCRFVKGKTRLGSNRELMPKGKLTHRTQRTRARGAEVKGRVSWAENSGEFLPWIPTRETRPRTASAVLSLQKAATHKIIERSVLWDLHRAKASSEKLTSEAALTCRGQPVGAGLPKPISYRKRWGRDTSFRGQSNLNLQTLFEDWKCILEYKDSG